MSEDLDNLGPLRPLAGVWEGDKGHDHAPSDKPENDREPVDSTYRERISLLPIGRVDNHEQKLYGLRYSTEAWRLSTGASFHQEVGYWLWDAANEQVMRCFIVPRGINVLAGGTVEPDARTFSLAADLGSTTFGICAAPFLDQQFKVVRYTLDIEVHDENSFSYHENTIMQMPGRAEPFHHTDRNRLTRQLPPPGSP